MEYVIDANIFIEASNRYYAFDIAPPFWDHLLNQVATGTICSIDKVGAEIAQGKDDLAKWSRTRFNHAYETTASPEIANAYRRIIDWVQNNNHFKDSAKTEFANCADGWIIAYALENNCTVVTHEGFDLVCKRKVLIPVVCRQFNIPFLNTFEMLRALGIRFR
ncbi:DUF4411 family protein [bacterium]|nr:DUF4411 family protein [bacterium]MBU1636420.1 DUF4411 family protein [bacterium]